MTKLLELADAYAEQRCGATREHCRGNTPDWTWVDKTRAALVAEIERVQTEFAETLSERNEQARLLGMSAERELALRARIDVLERDAARYQELRRGQHWSVVNGIGDTLRADDLDEDVDAVINPRLQRQAPKE